LSALCFSARYALTKLSLVDCIDFFTLLIATGIIVVIRTAIKLTESSAESSLKLIRKLMPTFKLNAQELVENPKTCNKYSQNDNFNAVKPHL